MLILNASDTIKSQGRASSGGMRGSAGREGERGGQFVVHDIVCIYVNGLSIGSLCRCSQVIYIKTE